MRKVRVDMLGMRLAGVALALALFAACGDDASVTTPPTPTPAPPTPAPTSPATPIIAGERAFPAPHPGRANLMSWDFTTPGAGNLEVTIDYLHDDSQVLVWVTNRQCNRWQFERDECFYLTKSIEGSRPRTLTASGVEAGTYSLFVANDGPHDEQVAYEVLLTPGTTGSAR